MFRIISALILALTATCALAQENLKLVDNPPERHIVVQGDTLWSIAGQFMKEPWRWPEIWRFNKDQIKNPHLIYPGDIVVLDISSGSPRLRLAKPLKQEKATPKIYSEALQKQIPSIPVNLIGPFLSKPLIIEADALHNVPRISATQEQRVYVGHGDTAFVNSIPDAKIVNWSVYRPANAIKDPETNAILGYEAFDLGTARLVQPGTPAIIKITTAVQEIGRGDHLVPNDKPSMFAYVPQAPEININARVIAMYGGLAEGGQYSIVSLTRGAADGVKVGHVLSLNRKRTSYGYDDQNKRVETAIPDERYGLVFVFRTFKNISYALVMEAAKPVLVGDSLRNP